MVKRLSLALLFLTAGLTAGLVLSGRMRTADDVEAQIAPAIESPAQSSRPGATPIAAPGPDFTRVAEQTIGAVTNISSVQVVQRRTPFRDPFFDQFFSMDDMFGPRSRYSQSLGSGVIVSADGFVVTNNHVLGEGSVPDVTVSLADKREMRAKVIGIDAATDLALLKIDARDLPVIPWGDSSRLKVAEWVMAIGNPYQLSETVTLGIVSALGRANVGISAYEDFIQTDAAINPGNSGGALVNSRGELIGINTAIFSQSGGYQGIGFAVPSGLVRRVVDDLTKFGTVRRGSIGALEVAPLTTQLAEELRAPDTNGIVIARMVQDSPAGRAGIQPGDIIVSVNGQAIGDTGQLLRAIADSPIGSAAAIDVIREGRRRTFKVPVEQQQGLQRQQRRGR
jgi:Do/DeqQ family serine protease